MKPTKELPEAYFLYQAYDPRKYKKAQWFLFALAIPLTLGVFFLIFWLAGFLRTSPAALRMPKPGVSLLNILIIVAFTAVVFMIHEMIHALLMWIFSRQWPAIKIGLFAVQVDASEWYFPRNSFIAINLAPFILISILLGVLILLLPSSFMGLLILVFAINAGGSAGDLASSVLAFLQPPLTYLNTKGSIWRMGPGDQTEQPAWKTRFLTLLESLLSKMG